MKKNLNLIYLCFVLLFVFLLVLMLNLNTISILAKEISIILLLLFLNLLLVFSFKLKKDKNYLKGITIRTVITYLMSFMIVIYVLGLLLGFNNSYLVLNFKEEISNLLPIIILIFETEFLRDLLLTKAFGEKKIVIIFTFLIAFLLILYEVNIDTFVNYRDIFVFVCVTVLPIFSQEFLCSYITYKISWIPSLIFKLVMGLYIYLIPIVPNLGDYIYSVFNILFPFLIYYDLNKMVLKYEKDKKVLRKKMGYVFTIPLLIFLITIVLLISGIFNYQLIAIASDSMNPAFSRGDALIINKHDNLDFKVGDVIAYKRDNIVVTHRINKIWKKGNEYYYSTKGDNNNSLDLFNPTQEDILGKAEFKFKYLGYPTVIVNDFFRKE